MFLLYQSFCKGFFHSVLWEMLIPVLTVGELDRFSQGEKPAAGIVPDSVIGIIGVVFSCYHCQVFHFYNISRIYRDMFFVKGNDS